MAIHYRPRPRLEAEFRRLQAAADLWRHIADLKAGEQTHYL